MSGPKAFRIVTRAEIIAICRRDLARLDAAVDNWTLSGTRNGTSAQSDFEKVAARRDELRRLLAADRFVELQKQVASEVAFLQADSERRIQKATEAAARANRDLRRSKFAAEALLQRLQTLKIDIPADIRAELGGSAASSDRLEAAMAKALSLFPSSGTHGSVTERQRELAAKLGAGERRDTLQEWISRQPQQTEDPSLAQVDTFLSELSGLGMDASAFTARVAALETEPPSRRPLVADSLLLDLANAVKDGRTHLRLGNALRERLAELSAIKTPGASSLLAEIDAALRLPQKNNAEELIKRADKLIEEDLKTMAAAERRRAVLEGLASLGYEVSEGMATAWVENGQVVLRKAANPGYGVELSGGKSDLLQVRAVGIRGAAETPDASRDRDMEEIWCGEFDRLKALVAKAGGSIALESARPAGQFPLKVVFDPNKGHDPEYIGRSNRSLPS